MMYNVKQGGNTEIIGKDDVVAQDEYSKSVAVDIGITNRSGELFNMTFTTSVTGTGSIKALEGSLFILGADPGVAVGDAALDVEFWEDVIGVVPIVADDWNSDANGGFAYKELDTGFHPLTTLYFVWLQTGATVLNAVAGDDETLSFNFWYKSGY